MLQHLNALGNALGSSLAASAAPQTQGVGPYSDPNYVNEMDRQDDAFVQARETAERAAALAGVLPQAGPYSNLNTDQARQYGFVMSDVGEGAGDGPYALAPGKVDPAAQKTAEQLAKQTLGKAAETGAEQAAKGGLKLAPFIESVAPWLGKLGTGVGLFFHMEDALTTDWSAAGSKFSHNQDDFTLRVTDGDSGKTLAVPGVHNPSQYSDAQYLSYVSYKANGGQLAFDDFVSFDPPAMGPVDRASSQKPDWLQRLDAGNAFNKERAGAYPYNEVYVDKPSGDGYFRVDSYNPNTREIVSRKFTQFSEITERTGIDYVSEMVAKYPSGATIANVPTNVRNGLSGEMLVGRHILEVPVQIKPIPQAVIDAANRVDVLIRDTKGKAY